MSVKIKPTKLLIRAPRSISAAKWKTMSNPAKAVAIAKDAIYRVQVGQLKPTSGEWAQFCRDDIDSRRVNDVQTLVKKGVKCSACALGGCIIGLAVHEDRMTEIEAEFSGQTRTRLEEIFGDDNLLLIEYTFEMGEGYIGSYELNDLDLIKRALVFGSKYRSPKTRFLAILENVAKNRGQFKP